MKWKKHRNKNTPNPVNPSWSWTETAAKLNQQSLKNRKEMIAKETPPRRKGKKNRKEKKKSNANCWYRLELQETNNKTPPSKDISSKKYTVVNKETQGKPPLWSDGRQTDRNKKGNWTKAKARIGAANREQNSGSAPPFFLSNHDWILAAACFRRMFSPYGANAFPIPRNQISCKLTSRKNGRKERRRKFEQEKKYWKEKKKGQKVKTHSERKW